MSHIRMFNDNLRIWVGENDLKNGIFQGEFDVLKIPVSPKINSFGIPSYTNRLVCEIKLFSAITSYALLGFDYTYIFSDKILTCKIPKPFRGEIIKQDITDTIYHGLEPEFARAIRDKLSESGHVLSSGELKISHVVSSDVGSSEFLFKKLVRILVFLLSCDQIESWSKDEFEERIGELFYQGLTRRPK